MKKYLVIGNPIEHSLSPKLHNYWIKLNNINAVYEKEKLNNNDLETLILRIRKKEISGVNITVPFKKDIIKYIDHLSPDAKTTQSVNTIHLEDDKILGSNTDIMGFELAIKNFNFSLKDKKIFIIGAGGVVPSIIFALKRMNVSSISISNRTKEKAENLKNLFNDLIIVNWGEVPNFDLIINATSLGLNGNDEIKLNFSENIKDKFFYDVIYNPKETSFLKKGKKLGNYIENGRMMFIHQAAEAFKIWHGIEPKINKEVIGLLD
jgi:shikimate dehydrogenase